jgi:hypothetical protein
MKKMTRPLFTAAAAVLFAAPAVAADFRWQGRLAAGQAIEVKGINGSVDARAATGDQVEVVARKHGRARELDEVKVEMIEHEGGVTVCALYPPRRADKPNLCRAGEGSLGSSSRSDVQVDFEVRVPKGVRFVGRTVNGGVEAEDLPEDAEAYTVNGSIRVTALGEVRATTVNGSIRAVLGRADGREPLSFRTVNGAITVELPATTAADVHAETLNGAIETDFDLTLKKSQWVGRRLVGVIGAGGRRLDLESVNGSITLRKAS